MRMMNNKPNTYTVYQHLTGEPVLANFVKVARYTSLLAATARVARTGATVRTFIVANQTGAVLWPQ